MENEFQLDQMEDALKTMSEFASTLTGDDKCPMTDCMWHCLAYIGSKGQHFGEYYARNVCHWYYKNNNIYQPFQGEEKDARAMAKRFVQRMKPGSYSRDKGILVYETYIHEGRRNMHAVIFDVAHPGNFYTDPKYFYIFDPQQNTYYRIYLSNLIGKEFYQLYFNQ
jgi:hypothetical protein